jgi:hypothetical protein
MQISKWDRDGRAISRKHCPSDDAACLSPYAVAKGWLVTDIAEEGPPHGICLTDAGRRLVAGR